VASRWVPNVLTATSLVAGVLAIIFTARGRWALAVALIVGAALFDSLNGRIARRLNAVRVRGRDIDIMGDLISFGVAPAALLYAIHLAPFGWWGCLAAAVFPVCGVFRLARLTTLNGRGLHLGLPPTVAGPVLAVVSVLAQGVPVLLPIMAMLALSGLMLSRFKVPKLRLRR